ncbi:MAG: M4 family metallopeptidase [Parcubacteria group bacterium]
MVVGALIIMLGSEMKIKNISLIILFFLLAFFCFFSKEGAYALENNQSSVVFKNLQNKIGPDFQYSLDQNTGRATFIANKNNALPLNLAGINNSDVVSVSNQFIKEYGYFFGITDAEKGVSFFKKDVDSLGMSNIRYGQKYKDVPVFGGQIIVHLGKNKTVNSANGKIIPDISIDTDSKISKDQAEDIAKNLWKEQGRPADPETLTNKLYIFNKSLFQSQPDDTKNYLVWRVDLYKDKPVAHEYYFIDAQNGDLVFQITGMQDAVDRRIYDCSWGSCVLDFLFYEYYYGRSEGNPVRGTNPLWGGTDVDKLYTEEANCHDYYSTKFSIDGANNLGGIGDGTNAPSAKTDGYTYIDYAGGSCPNAFFSGYNINFCQGWVTRDIVGHEYAHAVNTFSILDGYGDPAGLTYSGQPGALNESNSDVFGEALEYDIDGSSDWLIGEDLAGGASRDMSMPSNKTFNLNDGAGDVPYPNKFHDPNYYCGAEDNNGVHLNSSVPNHAAYLMAMGGTYNGCAITGIGREKEEAIFYRAQAVYYIPSTDFNGAYDNLISACGDLYGGTDSSDCKNVKKALQSVEMNQPGFCGGEPETTPECATTVATPVASPAGGTYSSEQTVTLSSATSGAAIYYTIDGNTPTISSTLYTGAITVSTSQTIKAIAVKSVMIDSDVMSETYTIQPTTSVYRFFNKIRGNHFYTKSETEKDNIIATLSNEWNYEGIAYQAFDESGENLMPLYRFFNTQTGFHFYTQNSAEKDNIIATLPVWNYEGIAYYTYSTSQPGTTAVYRFFNKIQGNHFYTTSATEKDNIINTLSATWNYEGIAWYAPE